MDGELDIYRAYHPLDEESWGSKIEAEDTHYSDKTGHRERGLSAKEKRKPRDRFYAGTGDPTMYARRSKGSGYRR